jgi:hypothetical protein
MSTVLLPWMMRNYRLLGKPVLSTNGGRNLWLGNNPESSVNSGSDIVMPPELAARISAATEIEADRIYSEEALKFVKANPKHYLWLAVQKGLALWRFDPSPTTEGYPRYKNVYSLISYISYAPILLFAVAGFFLTGRTDKKIELLWIFFGLAFTLLHAVYISKVRFRLPLDYFLIQMAATTLAAKIERSTAVKRFLQRLFAGFSHDQKTPLLSPRINSHRL